MNESNFAQDILKKIETDLNSITRGEYVVFMYRFCKTAKGNMTSTKIQKMGISQDMAHQLFELDKTFPKFGVDQDCSPMLIASWGFDNWPRIISSSPNQFSEELKTKYSRQNFKQKFDIEFDYAFS